MSELPERFQERMRELLGDEYEEFQAGYHRERAQGMRLNRLKDQGIGAEGDGRGDERWADRLAGQIAEEAGFSLRSIPWVKEGFYYGSEDRPGRHPYHEAGVYYIQEPSAMAVVELLDPKPGDLVLDLCAAPGGKSSHIASRLGGQGFLLSNEIHPVRVKILSQNIERMGIRNCVVSNESPEGLARGLTGFFDKIVVDAPCSGEGMFRKDEGARDEWSEEHVRRCAERQREILDQAASMLKPGGRLVYSTCTFAPEENEGTIKGFLEGHKDFSTEDRCYFEGFTRGNPHWAGYGQGEASGEGDDGRRAGLHLERTLRLMPHKVEGEGHFMASLRKEGNLLKEESETRKRGGVRYLGDRERREMLKDYQIFLKHTLVEPEEFLERKEYVLFGDQLYLVPPQMVDLTGLRILRPGLHMGTLKKNRFEPSHGLALALKPEEVKSVWNLPSKGNEILTYMKGETISIGEGRLKEGTAWVLISTDGYSMGWCKLAGGILKNHYPKGLRWR